MAAREAVLQLDQDVPAAPNCPTCLSTMALWLTGPSGQVGPPRSAGVKAS